MTEEHTIDFGLDNLVWEDVWFAMGYRGATPEPEIRRMAEEVAGRIVPGTRVRYMYRLLPAQKLNAREIMIAGTRFAPQGIICSYLDGMEEACVFVGTAGAEFSRKVRELGTEGNIVADFIADSIGTVLAEYAVRKVEERFAAVPNRSMSYSPGYCNWDIREQKQLFSLFPPDPCGITLTESSLMVPEKSVSGFLAMGSTLVRQPYHCEICKNKKCYKRREG